MYTQHRPSNWFTTPLEGFFVFPPNSSSIIFVIILQLCEKDIKRKKDTQHSENEHVFDLILMQSSTWIYIFCNEHFKDLYRTISVWSQYMSDTVLTWGKSARHAGKCPSRWNRTGYTGRFCWLGITQPFKILSREMLWKHRRMISLLICNTAQNKHCLTHLSQIMSFGGPSYRHWDLHLLHAQVLSYNNKSLLYKTLDTKESYSTKSLAAKRAQTASKTEVLASSLPAPEHTFWFYKAQLQKSITLAGVHSGSTVTLNLLLKVG